jgi:hypothetical protein
MDFFMEYVKRQTLTVLKKLSQLRIIIEKINFTVSIHAIFDG